MILFLASDLIISNRFANLNHRQLLISLAEESTIVQMISPFITNSGCQWLIDLKLKAPEKTIQIITEISARSITSGSLSINAIIDMIRCGIEVRHFSKKLHAKFYLFNRQKVVITSANLTSGGLENNIEIGVLLSRSVISGEVIRDAESLKEILNTIWIDLWDQSEAICIEQMEEIRILEDEIEVVNKSINKLQGKISSVLIESEPFISPKPCSQPKNFATEIRMSQMFFGFQEQCWNLFATNKPLTQENLIEYKKELSDALEPLLRRFFDQMIHVSKHSNEFKRLDKGVSKNSMVKNYFPQSKYLFLTRPQKDKKHSQHIGFPSIIFSIGVSPEGERYFDMMTGVEESFVNSLTEYGRQLLLAILNDREQYLKNLSRLEEGWYFTHGLDMNRITIPASQVKSHHLDELRSYLMSSKPADFFIKRRYSFEIETERQLLGSDRLVAKINEDFEYIAYFWNLIR